MIPVLRRLSDSGGSANSYAAVRLADLALRRLWRLAPAEARPRMLERIAKPSAGDTLKTLGALPDDTLLSTRAGGKPSRGRKRPVRRQSPLFQRYATGAVENAAIQAINPALLRHNCETVAAVVAYLARVDPPKARDVISRVRSMSNQAAVVVVELESFRMSPIIEDAPSTRCATAMPKHPPPRPVLRASGSASARDPLMAPWSDGMLPGTAARTIFVRVRARQSQCGGGRARNDADRGAHAGSAWRATAADLNESPAVRDRQLPETDGAV